MDNRPIGIFDSGRGGINVLSALKKRLFNERFIYFNDHKFCPYGDKPEGYILERVFAAHSFLARFNVKAILLACNTATAVGIDELRNKATELVFGVEPAIKALGALPKGAKTLALATSSAVSSKRFQNLLHEFGGENVVALGLKTLAADIEKHLNNLEEIREEIGEILAPHLDAKAVALGCTHYIFVKDIIADFFPKTTVFFDGVEGTVCHIVATLKERDMLSSVKFFQQDLFFD